jgi:site-specific recombinase XerD
MYYLGKYGSEASKREYDRIIAEFVANGRQAFVNPDELPVRSLIARYLCFIEKEREFAHGHKNHITRTLRTLHDLYGEHLVSQFTPSAFKVVRQHYVEKGLCRNTIKKHTVIVKNIFSWGVEEGIVPAEVGAALRMVQNLKAGYTAAVDYEKVKTVSDEDMEKTLPYVSCRFDLVTKVSKSVRSNRTHL